MDAKAPELRSDARRNRERIVAAGRELFRDSSDVPMYEVAKHAGVGQATLYRHFPDRFALAEAISEVEFAGVIALAETHAEDPAGLFLMLSEMAGRVAGLRGLIEVLRADAPEDDHERRRRETAELFAAPLAAARAAGTVRADLDSDDLFRLLVMVQAAVGDEPDRAARHRAAERALELIFEGLRPRT